MISFFFLCSDLNMNRNTNCDDAIVHNSEFAGAVGSVRVRVGVGRFTVGSPTGVGHRSLGNIVEGLVWVGVFDGLAEGSDLADLFEDGGLGVCGVSVDGEAGRVVATVLQTRETVQQSFEDVTTVLFTRGQQVCLDILPFRGTTLARARLIWRFVFSTYAVEQVAVGERCECTSVMR